jgi:NAD(P)-dependent dehydrogenase (short-subunit alcohol dehydrogenase family)
MTFPKDTWALILGGSSGMGLATAKKLVRHGMNCAIVHRDRRGALPAVEKEFRALTESGARVVTRNTDALSESGRKEVLELLAVEMGQTGKLRLLLHSLAMGNLKLLFPDVSPNPQANAREDLARALGMPPGPVHEAVEDCFMKGADALFSLAEKPVFPVRCLVREDFAHTVHAMGTSLVEWTQDIAAMGLFGADARVLALTSEGNQIAWRGYAAVSAAKAALESVCRSMAVELAPRGVRVNVIQAGVTETPALAAIPGNRHIRARAALRNPMGRLTRPEDVADAVYLLCLDEAAWINGALVCVDGGERIA